MKRPRSNWNLKVLVFEDRGNRSTQRKTSRSKEENQQQPQPTCEGLDGVAALTVDGYFFLILTVDG